MQKKFNLSILVAVFSFLFFTANAQNEGAVRMPETEIIENNEVVSKKTPEAVVSNEVSEEVTEKKAVEKREILKKVNELKNDAKVVKADRIKKNLKAEKTSVSQNVKIAIILIVVGAILSIFPILLIIGLILVLVGLVLLLLEII